MGAASMCARSGLRRRVSATIALAVLPVTLAIAVLLAYFPARLAARTPPASVLRVG